MENIPTAPRVLLKPFPTPKSGMLISENGAVVTFAIPHQKKVSSGK